ncbi:MAG: amidase, partial [Chloroflexi bacterium]
MTRPEELHFLTVAAAGRLIRDGALAPSRYVGAMIDRVRQLDPMLRCTITLAAETALADAQSAELE